MKKLLLSALLLVNIGYIWSTQFFITRNKGGRTIVIDVVIKNNYCETKYVQQQISVYTGLTTDKYKLMNQGKLMDTKTKFLDVSKRNNIVLIELKQKSIDKKVKQNSNTNLNIDNLIEKNHIKNQILMDRINQKKNNNYSSSNSSEDSLD